MHVRLGRVVSWSRRRSIVAVLVALAMVLAALTATAAVGAPNSEAVTLEPTGNKNNRDGSVSETGVALAKAKDSKERVEVKSEQTATDSVYANPDGTVSREKAAAPIRATGADGKLAPIDTDLVTADGRLAPKVATGDVSFSGSGEGELATYTVGKDMSVGLGFQGDLGVPKTEGSSATYGVAGSTTEQVRVGALADGLFSHVLLTEKPKEAPVYTFNLKLDGLTAKLNDGVLELSDAGGKVVARSRPLTMWDAARDEAGDPSHTAAVEAKLVPGENGGTQLQLTPSMTFLEDPKTKYPVTIDPDIAAAENRGDTYYFNGQATTDSRGTDYRLRTGYQDGATHRSLLTFGYKDFVGENVTKAELKLYQYSSATCTAKESNAFPTVTDTAASITWDTRPTIDSSSRFKSAKSFNHGQGTCPDSWEAMDVTSIVSAWAGGAINSDLAGLKRQGIELRASSENDSSHDKRFCSSNDASSGNCDDPQYAPVLSVTYAPELGDQDWYSMTGHQLNASSTLSVNNRSGNAYVAATDGAVNARGVGFGITRAYNSQSPATTSMGKGWNLNLGADVWIEKKTKYRFDYHAPDGAHFGSFFRETADSGDVDNYDDFITPLGGVGTDLDQDFDGDSSDHDNDPAIPDLFTMTMNDSQTEYRFLEQTSTGHAFLSKIVDRSGNEMTFTYVDPNPAAGVPKLASVTDAGGRTYTVTYTGNYITQISENGGLARNWKYTYNGDYLAKYTDPDNKETDYTYDTAFSPNLLKTVTNPIPDTGRDRPTTNIEYGTDSNLNINQVTNVLYAIGASSTYNYSWNYYDDPNAAAECDAHDHGDFATKVTDPNAGTTSFCFKHRTEAGGERKMYVYDGVGNSRTDEFNVDNQTQILTSGASGETVATYAAAKHDQLKTVTNPSSGTSGERTNIDYDHDPGSGSSSPKGEDYLPASVTDPNGDCIRYEYDSLGRMTEANTKLRGSGTDRSCADDVSGGVDSKFEYNTDGTLAKSADANGGTSDAEKTIHTYWATGDTGYVAGSKGLIKSVRKPGGDCATSTRKLCKSFTYDAAGRVTTVTDGNGIVTTMEYDKLDRTTKVLFNGTITCVTDTCTTYTYDAEGNLTSRVEAAGTTSFAYDRMNRQTAIDQPGSISFDMVHDGVGNLTGYTQNMPGAAQPDAVSYGYDLANSVTGVTDSSGTVVVNPDDDGRSENIHFPGTGDIEIDLDFKDNGKPEAATVRNTADGTLLEYRYDYTDGSDAEDQLQSRETLNAGSALNGTISYQYGNGRLDAASDSSSAGRSYTYEHDNINNVTEETRSGTPTHYGYDKAGQLCWSGATSGTKLGTTCPTTPAGNTTLTHDAAGNNLNTTADPTSYNNQNQVTNLGGLDMDYLDLGNDLRTTAGDATLVEGPLGITARKIGTDITWYTRMPDGTILNSRKAGVTQNYFTEPHNKSVAALYAPDGTRTATYLNSPYGDTTIHSEVSAAGADNPFRYISGFQDTGDAEDYYKLGARYYDGHGHFTQPDPLAGNATDPKTMTAYNYAGGDPINSSDPSGNCILLFRNKAYLTGFCARAKYEADKAKAARIQAPGLMTAGNLVACAVGGGVALPSANAVALRYGLKAPNGWIVYGTGCLIWVGFTSGVDRAER